LTDQVVSDLRAEITAADRQLLDAVNRRLEIVRRLHEHKAEQGIPMRDPAREQSLVRELQEENDGPLSDDGVASLFRHVLELTRKELYGA
jgi:chorismate mutase/prephenate dehydratase